MKVLKPGPRPFQVLGTICILMFFFPLFIGFKSGNWREAGKAAAFTLVLPALMLGPIAFVRVEVDEGEIRFRNFGVIRKRARFEDVGRSFVSVLAEKDWPISLTLLAKDEKTELMTLGLKMLRKEDVEWLLALPQLKLVR